MKVVNIVINDSEEADDLMAIAEENADESVCEYEEEPLLTFITAKSFAENNPVHCELSW